MRLNVYGRVQGVYFRKYAQEHALGLGLSGYARNVETGDSVEILAQGPQESLSMFLELIRQGPPHARVTKVTCEWQQVTEKYQGFEVRP